MKKLTIIILFLGLVVYTYAQVEFQEIEGIVTYISSQNVYVKFISAKKIKPGDQILKKENDKLIPAVNVENCSSFSCVGKPVGSIQLKVGDKLIAKVVNEEKTKPEKKIKENVQIKVNKPLTNDIKREEEIYKKQKIDGKLRFASYSTFSSLPANDNYRLRYTFSLNALNVSDSRFSFESYISFSHKLGEWNIIQEDIYKGLKLYSLNVKYEIGKNTTFWAGRKINPKVSSLGAIDGLQVESNIKNFYYGAVIGFRPDYTNYSFNSELLEYGAYMGHTFQNKTGRSQSSLAFFQQTNTGNVDRRFVYFQHQNSLLRNLNLFFSSELDLYQLIDGQSSSDISLTSFYVSLNYRPFKKLSLMGSYDNRKNVIYYETFKNYIDRLLEDASRQGVQLRVNYRPIKYMSVGLSSSYRVRENDVRPTKNINGFIGYNQIPWIKVSTMLSANLLQTSYLTGKIYGVRLGKDFFDSKLSSSINYRYVDYNFESDTDRLSQQIGELDLSFRFNRKFSMSVNYEATFENENDYHRIYFSAIMRF